MGVAIAVGLVAGVLTLLEAGSAKVLGFGTAGAAQRPFVVPTVAASTTPPDLVAAAAGDSGATPATVAPGDQAEATLGSAGTPRRAPRAVDAKGRCVRNPLSGRGATSGPTVAVKIDNAPAAWTHIGLDRADAVVTQEVEAGITRLVGLYSGETPGRVGIVRSARETDVEFLEALDHYALAFSGSVPVVRQRLKDRGHAFFNIDGGTSGTHAGISGSGYLERDPKLVAERGNLHSIVADVGGIAKAAAPTTPPSRGFGFCAGGGVPTAKSKSRAATKVIMDTGRFATTFSWRGSGYDVSYFYRDTGRKEQARSGSKPLTASSLLVVVGRTEIPRLGVGGTKVPFTRSVGRGDAFLFRAGKMWRGTWTRPSESDRFQFRTAKGERMDPASGQPWIVLTGSTPTGGQRTLSVSTPSSSTVYKIRANRATID